MSAAVTKVKVKESLDQIHDLLQRHRFSFGSESELQNGIAQILTDEGITFEREVPLLPTDRIDFMIGKVGLEVKVAGSLSSVTRQLFRYAGSDLIGSLLLVTSRIALHSHLPAEMNHKPLRVLRLVNSAL